MIRCHLSVLLSVLLAAPVASPQTTGTLTQATLTQAATTGPNVVPEAAAVSSSLGALLGSNFSRSSSQYLSLPDPWASGDIDFGGTCLANLGTLVGAGGVISKDDGAEREWALYYDGAGNFTFEIFDGAGASRGSVDSTITPVAGEWVELAFYHDAAANELGISANGGAFATAATSGVAVDTDDPVEIGRYNGATYHEGMLASCGFWTRTLTLADSVELHNDGNGLQFVDLSDVLLTNNTAWWDLDESSGDRNEQGSSTLAKRARDYELDNSEYHSVADPFARGNVDVGYALWTTLKSLADAGNNDTFLAQWNDGIDVGFNISLARPDHGTKPNEAYFGMGDGAGGSAIGNSFASTFGGLSPGSSYFIYAFYDADGGGGTDYINISVNDGAVDSVTRSAVAVDSAALFTIGAKGIPGGYIDSRVDVIYRFTTLPTGAEVTTLYNSHVPLECSEVSLSTGVMSHCWPLNETSGVALEGDTTGNDVDLADNNTVTYGQGVGQLWLLDVNGVTGGGGPAASDSCGTWIVRDFEVDNTEHFTVLDPWSRIDVDIGYAAHVRAESLPGAGIVRLIAAQWLATDKGFFFSLRASDDGTCPNCFEFLMGDGGVNNRCRAQATTFGAASAGTRYFARAYYDQSEGTCHISVDDGVVDSAAMGGAVASDSAQPFTIGAWGTGNRPWDGPMGPHMRFTTLPTSGEWTALYNDGFRLTCAEADAALSVGVMSHCWNLEEGDEGNALEADITGNDVDLTNVNTVTTRNSCGT